jgi:hypothetical protein
MMNAGEPCTSPDPPATARLYTTNANMIRQ